MSIQKYTAQSIAMRWHGSDLWGEGVEYVLVSDHEAALRACEQRSYTLGIEVGKHDGWVAGHAAGVQAARDAVEVTLLGTLQLTRDRVLAAIDALVKGEQA